MAKKPRVSDGGSDEVSRYLESLDSKSRPLVEALRGVILGVDKAVTENIKWKSLNYTTTRDFATMNTRGKTGLRLVLHSGAKSEPGFVERGSIDDPEGLIEWLADDRGMITFADRAAIERDATRAVLRQWVKATKA